MTKVYFVRHGYSEGNLNNRFHGQTDGDLTDIGHTQAELAGKFLADKKIDAVYSSDLRRAFKTAQHIAKFHNLEIIKHPGLREIFAGRWEDEIFSELSVKYPVEYDIWFNRPQDFVSPDGESMVDFFERITGTVRDIVLENPDKTIVIASHATPIRALNCTWENKDVKAFSSVGWVDNASVCEIDYEVSGDVVTPTPVCVNYTGHLGELTTRLSEDI